MYETTSIANLGKYEQDVGGWIAPDGKFYQAEFGYHDLVARRIVEYVFDGAVQHGFSGWLTNRGWLRLETDGRILHAYQATSYQFDILYQLYRRAEDGWYKDELWDHVVPSLRNDMQPCEPKQPVPPQGDQENLNIRAILRQRSMYV